MNKYTSYFATSLKEAITYRGQTMVWILSSFLWILVFPFIWLSIYGARESIEGYDRGMIVMYFLYIPVIETLMMSYLFDPLAEDIKEGKIVSYLIRPINYLLTQFWGERAWKIVRLGITTPIFIAFALLFREYLVFSPHIEWGWFILTIFLGTLLNFLAAAIIGLIAFWTIETLWVKQVWWMIQTLAFGYVAPIVFYPEIIQRILSYTPFPLMLQTPIAILLGQAESTQLLQESLVGAIWIVLFFLITVFLWKRGVKRFEGIGI